MNLEIKHLAPYLPYGLKITFDEQNPNMNWNIMSAQHLGLLDGNNISFRFKPILRPLSDLTKEIEHNGEKFIPIEYLWFNVISTDSDGFSRDKFYEDIALELIDFLPYKVMPYLFKWHFDCFNLIDNDLAIDINLLNK